MSTFRNAFYSLLPSWLTRDEGEKQLYALGFLKDAFAQWAFDGARVDMPLYAPEDAAAALGRDRKIVRGINEPLEAYAARLVRFLDDHFTRGNPFALMAQLAAYCQAAVRIRTVDRNGNWYTRDRDGTLSTHINAQNWLWDNDAATAWSRFWVVIYPTADGLPWAVSEAGEWPSGGTIGTTATPEQIATVQAIIREWKGVGRCEWIVIAYDDASFDPTAPEPDGYWRYNGKSSAGDYVPARLTTARYWQGTP